MSETMRHAYTGYDGHNNQPILVSADTTSDGIVLRVLWAGKAGDVRAELDYTTAFQFARDVMLLALQGAMAPVVGALETLAEFTRPPGSAWSEGEKSGGGVTFDDITWGSGE